MRASRSLCGQCEHEEFTRKRRRLSIDETHLIILSLLRLRLFSEALDIALPSDCVHCLSAASFPRSLLSEAPVTHGTPERGPRSSTSKSKTRKSTQAQILPESLHQRHLRPSFNQKRQDLTLKAAARNPGGCPACPARPPPYRGWRRTPAAPTACP